MKYFYLALSATVLLPLLSHAQSNYKPGYVINLKGDTLRGFIDYRDWDTNPTSINFKMAIRDIKAKKFTTDEISVANVDGLESFQKYSGPMSMDATNIDHLTDGRDSSFTMATVFLKVIQKGSRVALYSYSDNLKTRFYISEAPDFSPRELVYRIYYDLDAVTQNKGRTVNETGYRRQLLILASKFNLLNETLQNNIRTASYIQPDLLQVVSQINGVTRANYNKKYSGKTKTLLFASGGVNITSTSTAPTSSYYAAGGKSYTSYQPMISFGFEALANPNTGKLRFRMEGSFAKSQYRVSFQDKVYPYTGFKSSYDEFWISFTPQIIYNIYNAEDFKFYMGVGVFFTWYKYSNEYYGSPNSTTNFVQDAPYDFNTFDNAFLIKTGIQVGKHFGLYVNYLTNVATTRAGYFQLSKSGEQVGLSYFF